MGIFELMEQGGHEQVILCYNRPTNLRAIIAIHDTTLGNAVGGVRMWNYPTESEAISDALRLSRSMKYQNAIADCDFGGGKAVLWGDPAEDKNEAYLRAFGRFVEGLKGRFITFPDLGTDGGDLRYVRRETEHVIRSEGESEVVTAYGVLWGMKACVREILGVTYLNGLTVAIQGLGNVGQKLADYLKEENVELIVTDLRYDCIKRVQDRHGDVRVVRPEEIIGVECDIFSPCASGPVFDDQTIPQLRCQIIAGAAYNILADEQRHSQMLMDRGILCAPDFVISAGEMFLCSALREGFSQDESFRQARRIYDIMAHVISISKKEKIPPLEAAGRLAEERVESVQQVKSILC